MSRDSDQQINSSRSTTTMQSSSRSDTGTEFVPTCSQFAPGLLVIHNRKKKLIPQAVTMFLSGLHKQGRERNKWQASVLNVKFNIRPIQLFSILVSLPKDA